MRERDRGRFALAVALWLVPEVAGRRLRAAPAGNRAARRDRGSGAAVVAGTCAAAALALASVRFAPRAAFPLASGGRRRSPATR